MNAAANAMAIEQPPPTLIERVATLGALALAAALFQTVGWLVLEPDDPLGPISVLSRGSGLIMLLEVAVLTGVAAGLATVVAGRSLADVGVFAAALGLGLVSLRGGTVESLLLARAEGSASIERALALRFAMESAGWFLSVLVAIAVSAVVMRFCYMPIERESNPGRSAGAPEAFTLAGFELFGLWKRPTDTRSHGQTRVSTGLKHTLLACGVGVVAMAVLSAGLSAREIRHGQVCFVVAACVFVGTYVAQRFIPVRSALWPILSVALLAVGGYLWAAIRTPGAAGLTGVPVSPFLRILPVQFIAVGTAAAVATFWSVFLPVAEIGEDRLRHARKTRRDAAR